MNARHGWGSRIRVVLVTGVAAFSLTAPAVFAGTATAATSSPTRTSAAVSAGAVMAAANCRRVNVRNNYGIATGRICWHNNGSVGRSWITVGGKLKDYRGTPSSSFLYLRWKAGSARRNEQVQGASNGTSVPFDRRYRFWFTPSNIQLTLCSKVSGRWRCGVPQRF